jgi:hypothetical protein
MELKVLYANTVLDEKRAHTKGDWYSTYNGRMRFIGRVVTLDDDLGLRDVVPGEDGMLDVVSELAPRLGHLVAEGDQIREELALVGPDDVVHEAQLLDAVRSPSAASTAPRPCGSLATCPSSRGP